MLRCGQKLFFHVLHKSESESQNSLVSVHEMTQYAQGSFAVPLSSVLDSLLTAVIDGVFSRWPSSLDFHGMDKWPGEKSFC